MTDADDPDFDADYALFEERLAYHATQGGRMIVMSPGAFAKWQTLLGIPDGQVDGLVVERVAGTVIVRAP